MKKLTATPLAFMLIKSELARSDVNREPYAKIPERRIYYPIQKTTKKIPNKTVELPHPIATSLSVHIFLLSLHKKCKVLGRLNRRNIFVRIFDRLFDVTIEVLFTL